MIISFSLISPPPLSKLLAMQDNKMNAEIITVKYPAYAMAKESLRIPGFPGFEP